MAHLLESINPEAAEQIDHPAEPAPVGTPVVYIPRAGFGRQQRSAFPAVIVAHNEDGTAELLVTYGLDDQVEETHVRERSSHNHDELHVWHELPMHPETEEALESLNESLEALRAQVYGEFKAPPKALMTHLNDFDERLRKIEAAISNRK